MESTIVISASFDQNSTFWDTNGFPLPPSASIEFGGEYQTVPIDPSFSFEETPPYAGINSSAHTPRAPAMDWPHSSTWPSVESTLPASEGHVRPKMPLEPHPQTHLRTRKAPSGQTIERRRQQNRVAQLAFRERSKKQAEEMRQELTQCVEFNKKICISVRELLDRTETLKKDMEAILTLQPPVNSCDTSWPPSTNCMELLTSPES